MIICSIINADVNELLSLCEHATSYNKIIIIAVQSAQYPMIDSVKNSSHETRVQLITSMQCLFRNVYYRT